MFITQPNPTQTNLTQPSAGSNVKMIGIPVTCIARLAQPEIRLNSHFLVQRYVQACHLRVRSIAATTALTRLLDEVLGLLSHDVQAAYRLLQIRVDVVQHPVLLVQLLRDLQADVQSPTHIFATHEEIDSGREVSKLTVAWGGAHVRDTVR